MATPAAKPYLPLVLALIQLIVGAIAWWSAGRPATVVAPLD